MDMFKIIIVFLTITHTLAPQLKRDRINMQKRHSACKRSLKITFGSEDDQLAIARKAFNEIDTSFCNISSHVKEYVEMIAEHIEVKDDILNITDYCKKQTLNKTHPERYSCLVMLQTIFKQPPKDAVIDCLKNKKQSTITCSSINPDNKEIREYIEGYWIHLYQKFYLKDEFLRYKDFCRSKISYDESNDDDESTSQRQKYL